jgi:hypothetical protein
MMRVTYIDAPGSIPLERLIKARQILKVGGDICRNRLQRLGTRDLQERLSLFEKEFELILTEIGGHLFNAAKLGIVKSDEQQSFEFYFWPGYDSLLKKEGSNRITLKCSFSNRDLGCGLGFSDLISKVTESFEPKISDTSYWYDALLTQHEEDVFCNGEKFTPGSMHLWVTRSDLKLNDESPLNIIAFQLCSPDKDSHSFDTGPRIHSSFGMVEINLWEKRCIDWGSYIAEILNDTGKVKSQWAWPFPSPPSKPISLEEYERVDYEPNKLQQIQQKLYSMWISANIGREKRKELWNWVNEFQDEIQDAGLLNLSKRISDGLEGEVEKKIEPNDYKYWYVIVLERTFALKELEHREGLGSVMILSSCAILPPFLMVIKQRLEWVYLLLRYFEGATLIDRYGRTSQAHFSGHEAGAQLASASKLVPYVKEDVGLVNIIQGSLTYAELFISTKPSLSGLEIWLIKSEMNAAEWLQACIEYAWYIVIARESRTVTKKNEVFGPNGIVGALKIGMNCSYSINPGELIYSPPGKIVDNHPTLPWDISRWMLAALSNAIKWSGPKTGEKSGPGLIREWSSSWHENHTSPFKPIKILISSYPEKKMTELTIYNGYYKSGLHTLETQDSKSDGTDPVLQTICYSLPGFERLRFEGMTPSELQQFLPGENQGFATSVRLNCGLFRLVSDDAEA